LPSSPRLGMPSVSTQDFAIKHRSDACAQTLPVLGSVHPCTELSVSSEHVLTLDQQQNDGSWQAATINDGQDHFTVIPVTGFFPEATWALGRPVQHARWCAHHYSCFRVERGRPRRIQQPERTDPNLNAGGRLGLTLHCRCRLPLPHSFPLRYRPTGRRQLHSQPTSQTRLPKRC